MDNAVIFSGAVGWPGLCSCLLIFFETNSVMRIQNLSVWTWEKTNYHYPFKAWFKLQSLTLEYWLNTFYLVSIKSYIKTCKNTLKSSFNINWLSSTINILIHHHHHRFHHHFNHLLQLHSRSSSSQILWHFQINYQ